MSHDGLMVQTGPVQIAGHWRGVYVSHEEALAFARAIREHLDAVPNHATGAFLFGLVRLLESCDGPAVVTYLDVRP